MSELPLVQPGEIIASDHINEIMLRSTQRYANAATRDVETPTPVQGELAYLEDTGELQVFNGTDWVMGGGGVVTGRIQFRMSTPVIEMYDPAGSAGWQIVSTPTEYTVRTAGNATVLTVADGASDWGSSVTHTYSPSSLAAQGRDIQIFGGVPTGGKNGDVGITNQGGGIGVYINSSGTWVKVGTP